ncbi:MULTISPECIES: S24 family peptidase [unclassified Variovorax]|uniref:LexA family protein n=1 Tax=unclassified Variovorax TaxID=663243 RepID=UPI00257597D9|nr:MULTISPECIES: S24 family peptidase [unclassified Variovorax]MDM0086893.1 S24 family peptidase [Variovorax sp. J22G40]MDM0144851.1 S24 family peptidase [Variovorax sp. J2P1-31]
MHSHPHPFDASDLLPQLTLIVAEGCVPTGFPSSADKCAVKRHDLNELLVTHPAATFMWRVSGQLMIEAGIFNGDVIVVNRALTPAHKDIVVAQVDSEFTVKYLYKRADRVKLMPANPTFPTIMGRWTGAWNRQHGR